MATWPKVLREATLRYIKNGLYTIWDFTCFNFVQVKIQEKERQHELTLADLHRQKEELLRKHTTLATELNQRQGQCTELESTLHQWGELSFLWRPQGYLSAYLFFLMIILLNKIILILCKLIV